MNFRHALSSSISSQPGKNLSILLQLSSNTYNAYNNWGGFSLYGFHGLGLNQGHRVSFERPPASQFGNWEQSFVEWAERKGYVAAIPSWNGSRKTCWTSCRNELLRHFTSPSFETIRENGQRRAHEKLTLTAHG